MWTTRVLAVLALLAASVAAGPVAEPRTGIMFPEALKGAKLSKLGVRTKGPIKVTHITMNETRGNQTSNRRSRRPFIPLSIFGLLGLRGGDVRGGPGANLSAANVHGRGGRENERRASGRFEASLLRRQRHRSF